MYNAMDIYSTRGSAEQSSVQYMEMANHQISLQLQADFQKWITIYKG